MVMTPMARAESTAQLRFFRYGDVDGGTKKIDLIHAAGSAFVAEVCMPMLADAEPIRQIP